VATARLTFPLVPRGRVAGLSFGSLRSLHRGTGTDIAGTRPYHPGDDMHAIDWGASARLSTAKGSDEFVVRERFAEEAPKVMIVCDRRPEMAHFAPPLPWLDKPAAMRNAIELVLASSGAAGGYVGYLDFADGDAHWRPPKGERKLLELQDERLMSPVYGGPDDWLERSFAHLAEYPRAITAGTFLFVLSDFLVPPVEEVWLRPFEHRWDVVPVIVQDPTWEQSFPDVAGIVVPLRDARTGRISPIRLTRREVAARRVANEERLADLLATLRDFDIDPVLVSSADPAEMLASFFEWTEVRRVRRLVRA
jgi:uncharacterized protein (DUF58 family)